MSFRQKKTTKLVQVQVVEIHQSQFLERLVNFSLLLPSLSKEIVNCNWCYFYPDEDKNHNRELQQRHFLNNTPQQEVLFLFNMP